MAEKNPENQVAAAEPGEAHEILLDGVSYECADKNALELVQEEEREKQRAEKRKDNNKRRKKKKKEKQLQLNKNRNKDSNTKDDNDNNKNNTAEEDDVTKQKKKECLNGNLSKEKNKESEEEEEEEEQEAEAAAAAVSRNDTVEEDFLDLNSAFVTNVANRNKRKSVNKICNKKTMNVDSAADDGEEFALHGYLAAKNKQYVEAVNYFTKAINFNKNDYRLYSNRSFCYCQLGQYEKGLKDADRAIKCLPNSPRAYFHKGQVLKHLKQYKEAEEAFLKALELDDSIVEVPQELNNLKVQQLVDMGFKLPEAQTALQQHCTLEAAVEALSVNQDEYLIDEDEIFYSDDDEEELAALATNENTKLLNPLGLTSLWVGNVTESVTEYQLLEMFSRYGEITSIKLLPQSFCAFINYRDKSAPGPAMRFLQGRILGGQNLIIRFPNNATVDTQQKALHVASTNHLKAKGPVNSNECHFWRTTGCAFGDKCRFVHIREHKGIDRKPWHKMTEQ